ncbi:DNA topoisomerase I, mitochondrial-like isoform X1 [Pelobates cultripes]|uniref:DNA topoisomerase I, mitochondrial-like isoform X1 n=1 Tax=Pelobates cultripes TaxID=61616 RepID=A0AAD1TC95_PELCU|nr:DNA topoisomerase I, mitochondrial-like isoform X1 [Pelobates cultripes]
MTQGNVISEDFDPFKETPEKPKEQKRKKSLENAKTSRNENPRVGENRKNEKTAKEERKDEENKAKKKHKKKNKEEHLSEFANDNQEADLPSLTSVKAEPEDEDFAPKKKKKKRVRQEETEEDVAFKSKKKKIKMENDEDTPKESVKKNKEKKKIKKEQNADSKPKKKTKEEKDAAASLKIKKKEEEEQARWRWWEEEKYEDGIKWKFLEHKGPIFAPPYEPLPPNVKFYYDGKPFQLSLEAEEVASFFAKMLDHDYTTRDVFRNNFFGDWKKEMTLEEKMFITDLAKCDFSEMFAYFKGVMEERKNRTKEEKLKLKEENEKLLQEFGFCIMDHHREKIGNFKIEPPGLFRGRGDHPKQGMLKKRIVPEDIIINCSNNITEVNVICSVTLLQTRTTRLHLKRTGMKAASYLDYSAVRL